MTARARVSRLGRFYNLERCTPIPDCLGHVFADAEPDVSIFLEEDLCVLRDSIKPLLDPTESRSEGLVPGKDMLRVRVFYMGRFDSASAGSSHDFGGHD